MHLLETKGLQKTYNRRRVVDGVDISVKRGEIVGLLGPNGAGKTTTFYMITGLIEPDKGEVIFDNQDITNLPMHRRARCGIGYLAQEPSIFRKLTVEENIMAILETLKISKKERRKRLEMLLGELRISHLAKNFAYTLSGGERRRLEITRALVTEPLFVLFDEPFSGLDPVSQDTLLEAVLELKAKGKTVLFSTHVMEQAERLCDRILLVRKGRELVSGSLAELKSGYGTNSVQIEFDGDGSFIANLPCVADVRTMPRWIEASLAEGHGVDELFSALSGRVSVRRFQLMEPSLHALFVSLVESSDDAGTDDKEAAHA